MSLPAHSMALKSVTLDCGNQGEDKHKLQSCPVIQSPTSEKTRKEQEDVSLPHSQQGDECPLTHKWT